MKTIIFSTLLYMVGFGLFSQVPQGFNYQAIARNSQGNPITSASIKVKLSILTDTTGFFATGSGNYLWEEEHSGITTNSFGLFTVIVGNPSATKVQGTATSFSAIDWSITPLYIGVKVANPTDYKNMGSARLWSVPYSMISAKSNLSTIATNANNATNADHALLADSAKAIIKGSKLSVISSNDSGTNALFEVKRKDGQTVFAVYPDAVNIYVPRTSKGNKGGFAIGGLDGSKTTPQDYFRVTPDSVRIYINNNPPSVKGSTKGGFAIGGYDGSKGVLPNFFMNVTGASAVNTVDSASQILWYPNKQAFLAGRISITTADSVGTNSTALGYKSRAIGNYSQAFGYKTTARGDYSTAIGQQAVAGARALGVSTASNAFAFGNNAYARGNDSYAFGSGAIASGYRSVAIGSVGLDDAGNPTSTPTTANMDYATAIGMGAQSTQKGALALGIGATSSGYYSNSFGYYSTSSGYYSTALGFRSTASNNYAGAFGFFAKADGVGSMALGRNAWAVSNYSIAVGDSSKTQADYASAFGRFAKAKGSSSVAVGNNAQTLATDAGSFGKNSAAGGTGSIAIGNGATTASTATDGSAIGKLATATGASSLALGVNANSIGSNSIAIGNAAVANADNSTSFGSNTTTSSSALYSTTMGYGSSTQGQYATAIGYNSQSNGDKSLAIGSQYTYTIRWPVINRLTGLITWHTSTVNNFNTATRSYSIAIGNGNTAQDGGMALGSNNSALALGAVSLGHSNEADTSYSFAAGYNSLSTGLNATAIGDNATAQSANSFVIGTYNTISGDKYNWVSTDPLFVIGNGESGTPHNAITVSKNGNTTINGSLTVTGTITSYVGTGDGLGNHTASQNLKMNGYWLSNDGGNEGVFVTTAGLVGINTSSPAYTFDVAGSVRSTGSMVAGGNLYGTAQIYGYNNLYMTGSIYGSAINPDNNANLTIDAGTLHVDGTNNRVGINNTSPSYGLDVTGTMYVSGTGRFGGDVTLASSSPAFYFTDTDAGDDDFIFGANQDTLSVTTQGKFPTSILKMSSNGVVKMPASYNTILVSPYVRDLYIDYKGTVGYISSSMRYKKNIEDLVNIDWLYNLRPVTYQYKSSLSDESHYGLIAEEVQKVNPYFVSLNEKGTPETVNYSFLITPLLKAIQDQKKSIDELKSENEMLKERLDKLESAISTLVPGTN